MKILPEFMMNALRKIRLRRRFPLAVIHNGAIVDNLSSLEDYVVIFRNARVMNSTIGRYSYIQEDTDIYLADIGPFCSIAANVTIGLQDHPMDFISTSPVFYDNKQPLPRFLVQGQDFLNDNQRTIIEADVWIGEGAKIRAGIKVGVGAVIGAGSIVTKDVAPYSIAAGIPCKTIKYRFPNEIISMMQETAWWRFDEKKLKSLSPFFNDPISFIELSKNN